MNYLFCRNKFYSGNLTLHHISILLNNCAFLLSRSKVKDVIPYERQLKNYLKYYITQVLPSEKTLIFYLENSIKDILKNGLNDPATVNSYLYNSINPLIDRFKDLTNYHKNLCKFLTLLEEYFNSIDCYDLFKLAAEAMLDFEVSFKDKYLIFFKNEIILHDSHDGKTYEIMLTKHITKSFNNNQPIVGKYKLAKKGYSKKFVICYGTNIRLKEENKHSIYRDLYNNRLGFLVKLNVTPDQLIQDILNYP